MKKTIAMLLALVMMLSLASIASAEGKTIVYWSMWEST